MELLLESAARDLDFVRKNSAAFLLDDQRARQAEHVAALAAQLRFVRTNRTQIAADPSRAFGLALEAGGRVARAARGAAPGGAHAHAAPRAG